MTDEQILFPTAFIEAGLTDVESTECDTTFPFITEDQQKPILDAASLSLAKRKALVKQWREVGVPEFLTA